MSILDLLGVDQNGNASPLDARDTASSDPIGAIERVALQNGINPDHLIGLAKLETRLGDATIKGDDQDTFNLFNIKDFSKEGTGIRARDKAEGSNHRYRRYDSYEASAQDLVGLLERRYPGALTAATPEEFAKALKAGGYATDPAYVQKLTSTIGSSTNGSSTKNTAQPSDSVVDRLIGKDEALNLIFGGSNGLVDVPQPEPIKNRSFGDVLRDTGIAALKVGPTAVNQIAEVGDMLTGGKFDFGVSKTMKRGMEAFDELGSEGFKRSKEGFAAVMQDDTKGIGDMFAYALDNPAVLVDNIIPTVGSMFLPAGAAKVAAGGARLMGAAQPVVQKAAVATSIGAGAAQNAAQTFAELKDKSLPERYAGAATSFAVSALMGIATGGGADGAIARRMAGELKEGKIGLDKVKSFLKSVGKEALQESGEESGNVLGKYVGSGELPSPQSYGKQVAFSGALGGLMGGGVDLATGQSFGSGGIQPAEAPATPPPSGPLTRALNAGTPPATPLNPKTPPESAPTAETTTEASAPAAATAVPSVVSPAPSDTSAAIGQDEIDPEMAAMADTDLAALIAGIESSDEAKVSDDDWVRYYLAKEEVKRRNSPPATAKTPAAQTAAVQATEATAPVEESAAPAGTYMPGAEVNANRVKEQPKVVLQNRDRSGAASVQQMSGIASNPDFLRIGPSTEMTTGAPVVFGNLPPTAVKGRPETVVDGKGDRIQAQYVVVDANDLIASNNADGTPVDAYINGLPGKLRAVAGNGRTAGIQKAYQQGTAQKYRQDLIENAQTMGLDAAAIEAMQQPVLVRVMDAADVRDDMGDRTNITGTQRLSPVEQASNDARRLNLAELSFDENGNPTQETLRRFINGMPDSEKGDLIAGKEGTPTRQAAERLMAATFKQAYDSDELVELYAQAPEPEARAILNAAAEAAGALSALKEMNPDFDVREAVAGAVKMAVNAARQQKPLAEFAQNADLDTDPDAFAVARFLGQYANKPRQMANGLREWARDVLGQAEIDRTNQSQGGLFGAQPTLTRDQLFARLGNIDPNDEATIQARDALAKRDAEKPAIQEQAADAPESTEATDFSLETQTPEQLQAQADERAAEEKRQRNAEQAAETKTQADAELGDFTLTGSDRPSDANPNQGDLLAADQPQQGDIQNYYGEPFSTKGTAQQRTKKKDARGGQVVPVQGGFVVRMPQNMSGAPSATMGTRTDAKAGPGFTAADVVRRDPIAGQKINDEWTAFAPQSGTLGIPRAEMPQVKAGDRGAMVNFLKARGIYSSKEQLPPTALKPTQAEFSPAKVQEAADRTDGDRSIIVSADGHVVDGHHQWLAQRQKGELINVIRLGQPITQVLDALKEMPSAQPEQKQDVALTNEGAKPAAAQPQADVTLTNEGDMQAPPEFASFEAKTALLSTNPDLVNANGDLNERGNQIARTSWGELSPQDREMAVGLSASRRASSDAYNDSVREQERQGERRRLQGDRIIQQANGKPFKTEANAQAKLDELDLSDTHAIQQVDGGFVLRRMPPAEQAEQRRKAEGRESYTEAQAAVAAEMGIGENADGELDATDEQFAEMERRVAERMGRKLPAPESTPNQAPDRDEALLALRALGWIGGGNSERYGLRTVQGKSGQRYRADIGNDGVAIIRPFDQNARNQDEHDVVATVDVSGMTAAAAAAAIDAATPAEWVVQPDEREPWKWVNTKQNQPAAQQAPAVAATKILAPDMGAGALKFEYPSLVDNQQRQRIEEWFAAGGDPATKPAERGIYLPGMSVGKLERLIAKESPTAKDVESLKDYKYLLLAQQNDAAEKGFMTRVTADHGGFWLPKNKFWLTNIDQAIDRGNGSLRDAPSRPKQPQSLAQQEQAATESAAQQPEKTQPVVARADVAAAERLAADMIRQKIDGMKAGEVQRIAARFLPTMGKKAPVGKAKIADAMTDTSAFSLLNPAAELGVELSESVKRALMADREGRVVESSAEAPADQPTQEAATPSEGVTNAPTESRAPFEPNPLEHTPKQYADAWLRWSAETNGLPLAEVREMQGDEAGLKNIEQRWVDAVVNQAKSGQSLPAKTLDKLLEIRPNTVLPESAIPAGYQRPEARKLEKARKSATTENELEAIFAGLEADGLKKRKAKAALAERTDDAEVINQVEAQFYDVLVSLMDRGDLEINGHKTIHKDIKSCL